MRTRAVIFVQPGEVALEEIPLPDPTPRDIVVETEVSGISVGTERWAFLGKRAEVRFPSVPGYQSVGQIVEVGPEAAARGWKVGERVFYFSSRFTGKLKDQSWMGGHVAHAVIDGCGPRSVGELETHHCERVPEGLAPEHAALSGLCAVALRGIEMAGVPASSKVLVCGLGVIGQFAHQICQLKGASVVATDVVKTRLEIAEALGARSVENKGDDLRQVAEELGGFDVVIDTSSHAQAVNALFPLLKLRGKFIFQGWYPPPTPLDLNALHLRLPTAYFPCGHTSHGVEASLRWARQGWVKTEPLLTHTFRPEEAGRLYSLIAKGSEEFLGIIIDWRNR